MKLSKLQVAAAATIGMIVIMLIQGYGLKTHTTPSGILNLELADKQTIVERILLAWDASVNNGKDMINVARWHIYLDFILLICYGTFFFLLLNKVAAGFSRKSILGTFGRILSVSAFAAMVLNCCENGGMLSSLSGHLDQSVITFTVLSSLLKWGIIGIMIFYLALSMTVKKLSARKSAAA